MFRTPDGNFQAPWIHGKTIFVSLVDPRSIVRPVKRPALRARLSWLFSISGVTSALYPRSPHARPKGAAVEKKKLTFKPAIKTKNVKSLILKAPPARPSRGRQLADAYNPRWQPYFSDIASRARSVPRRHPRRNPRAAVCISCRITRKIRDFYTLNFKIHFGTPRLILFVRHPTMDRCQFTRVLCKFANDSSYDSHRRSRRMYY